MSLDVDSDSDLLIGRSSNGIGSGSVNSPVSHEQRREIFDLKNEDVCGVVYGCDGSSVAVGLMNLVADEEISHRIFTVAAPHGKTIDFARYHSFALVGSKLFAIGGEPTYELFPHPDIDYNTLPKGHNLFPQPVYPREVYSCDLSTINSGEPLKFKQVATLEEPKILALLVPYKDKLFIIADPCQEPKQTKTPCEILLHLNEDNPTAGSCLNPAPFWKCDDDSFILDGHVVVGDRLYVRVKTWETPVPSLTWYCLNMDTEIWDDGKCVVPPILNDVYDDKRPLNYVYGDKLFEPEWDEDPCIPTFKVVKLKDDDKVVVDLKGVAESMELKGFFVLDGWVLPCDEHNTDVFCLMIWLQDLSDFDDYIRGCKFKLGDDGSFDILTKQVVTCGPFPRYGKPFVGFTSAITKVLNAGEYRSKLFYKNLEDEISIEKKEAAESYQDFNDVWSIPFQGKEKEADDPLYVEVDMGKILANMERSLVRSDRARRKRNQKKGTT
ncbi:hypothetical protein LINGRAPRIM_LOCUS1181 [Linum grandiflorum]